MRHASLSSSSVWLHRIKMSINHTGVEKCVWKLNSYIHKKCVDAEGIRNVSILCK